MAVPDFCNSRFSATSKVAVTVCVSICAVSVGITIYIRFGLTENDELLRSAESLQRTLQCLSDDLSEIELAACEQKYGLSKSRQEDILPTQCIYDNSVVGEIQKMVERTWRTQKQKFVRRVPKEQYSKLETATGMCYSNQNRFIVHWFAWEDAGTGITAHQWHHIANLISDRSVYTVSPGHEDTFVDGTVKIFKDGLYLVYAKVVVKCTKADKQSKRVFFEVRMNEHYGDQNWETILLRDVGNGVCNLQGDLLTLFQQGLIRMSKNSLVYVRVKLPGNVTLSDDNSIYKTNIGVSWVGLS